MNKSSSVFRYAVLVIWAVASASATAAVDPLVGAAEVISDRSGADAKGFSRSLNYANAPVGEQDFDDARGGDASLILRIAQPLRKNGGFQVPLGDVPLPAGTSLGDVEALGSVAFDYYLDTDLQGQEVTFKIYCNNENPSNILAAFIPSVGEWKTQTFDLSKPIFRKQNTTDVSLNDYIDEGWCDGTYKPSFPRGAEEEALEISELLITVGSSADFEEEDYTANFYIDYVRVGTNAKTYDFEMADEQGFDEVPEAPVDLVATPGDGEAVIAFTQPDSEVTVDNYSYSYSTDGTNYTDYAPLDPADKSTSIAIKALTNNTTYSIKLKAVHINENNEQIASEPSVPVNNVIPVATKILPNAPIISSIEPGNQQVKIFFTQPPKTGESAIEDYVLKVAGFEDGPTGQTQSPITYSGGSNGESYTISIYAKNADGPGPDSNLVTVILPADSDGDGVPDPNDACPNDPTCTSLPVPTLPWPALLTLLGLMGWYGKRRLMF
jgi:hypothetical protein